jgi:hypothetical protein
MSKHEFFEWVYYFISYEGIFVTLSTIVNAFFVLYVLGFLKNQNQLVDTISVFLKVFIGLFLIVRFNPFYNVLTYRKNFSEFDRKVVYSAGCYILIINGIVVYNDYLSKEQETIQQKLDRAKALLKEAANAGASQAKE